MYTDLPEEQWRAYRSGVRNPEDFDRFWADTLAEARSAGSTVLVEPAPTDLAGIDVYDVTLPGFAGQPVRAWLRVPSGAAAALPTVVQYAGYGGGRGHPLENREVRDYLAVHRDAEDRVLNTLAYVDGVNFARRCHLPARYSVALMDDIVPPSTVFAAVNAHAGPTELSLWRYNGHEAGGIEDDEAALRFLGKHLADDTDLAPGAGGG